MNFKLLTLTALTVTIFMNHAKAESFGDAGIFGILSEAEILKHNQDLIHAKQAQIQEDMRKSKDAEAQPAKPIKLSADKTFFDPKNNTYIVMVDKDGNQVDPIPPEMRLAMKKTIAKLRKEAAHDPMARLDLEVGMAKKIFASYEDYDESLAVTAIDSVLVSAGNLQINTMSESDEIELITDIRTYVKERYAQLVKENETPAPIARFVPGAKTAAK